MYKWQYVLSFSLTSYNLYFIRDALVKWCILDISVVFMPCLHPVGWCGCKLLTKLKFETWICSLFPLERPTCLRCLENNVLFDWESYGTHKYTVWQMQSFWMLHPFRWFSTVHTCMPWILIRMWISLTVFGVKCLSWTLVFTCVQCTAFLSIHCSCMSGKKRAGM
jgi:hypothetical protein